MSLGSRALPHPLIQPLSSDILNTSRLLVLFRSLPLPTRTKATTTRAVESSEDQNYERLEYIGDAIIRVAAIRKVSVEYPELTLHETNTLRDLLVSNAALAQLSKLLGLNHLINPPNSRANMDVLSDVFESVIGAINTHHGLEVAASCAEEAFGLVIKEKMRVLPDVLLDKKRPVLGGNGAGQMQLPKRRISGETKVLGEDMVMEERSETEDKGTSREGVRRRRSSISVASVHELFAEEERSSDCLPCVYCIRTMSGETARSILHKRCADRGIPLSYGTAIQNDSESTNSKRYSLDLFINDQIVARGEGSNKRRAGNMACLEVMKGIRTSWIGVLLAELV